ncbi:MAG: VOC family protein [Candidatus Binatia bacterium]|nr:VOC family protein [Candidatus Binatia bacterium]
MRAEKLDQVTINVKNLEESVQRFSAALGIQFLPPREVTVGNTRLRFAWSPIGLGLVESDPPEPEGFRAIGLKVDNLAELKATMTAQGLTPVLEVERERFREAHYVVGGVRFSIAEYPDPPPIRVAAVLLGNLLAEQK